MEEFGVNQSNYQTSESLTLKVRVLFSPAELFHEPFKAGAEIKWQPTMGGGRQGGREYLPAGAVHRSALFRSALLRSSLCCRHQGGGTRARLGTLGYPEGKDNSISSEEHIRGKIYIVRMDCSVIMLQSNADIYCFRIYFV